jgi:cardiolipin synthase
MRKRAEPREPYSTDNRARLLHDGAVALPAMLEGIRAAKHEVLLEMYWFASDKTGREFADVLSETARRGVCVRVIYDAVGSIDAEESMFRAMRDAGCEIYEFNPIAPWRTRFRFSRLNLRDHRKLLVVDGLLGITGGINLGDPWAPRSAGGAGFRDDAIEVRGEAAGELRALFYRTFPEPPIRLPSPPSGHGDVPVMVLANDLHVERRDILDNYINAIARATRDVTITNSYFIPSYRVRRALKRAVQRGVRVRVIVPRDSDVRAAQFASRALYEQLLEAGIEIYEWRGGVLHSKTAVVDDEWCTVGSFNFDALSLNNNLEVNIAVKSRGVTHALREKIEADLLLAERVELERFRQRTFVHQSVERFFYAFRWML